MAFRFTVHFAQDASCVIYSESEIVHPKIPILAQEINAALREWHKLSKKLFMSPEKFPRDNAGPTMDSDQDCQTFQILKQMIIELHECRKRVMASNLTVEGLKELKKQAARIIDTGNK